MSVQIRFLPGESFDDVSGMARIEAVVDGASVGCLVSPEAVAERVGGRADAAEVLGACRAHRGELEEMARKLILRGEAVGRRVIQIP